MRACTLPSFAIVILAGMAAAGCDRRLVVGADPLPDLSTGLVAYWTFDPSPLESLPDASGNGNHGGERSFSVTDQVPGVHGSALEFGQAGWFEVEDSPSLSSLRASFTFATWINLPFLVAQRGVVLERRTSSGIAYSFTLDNGILAVAVGDTVCAAPSPLAPERWYHVAAIDDGSALRIFLDGVPIVSCSAPSTIASTTAPLTVGASLAGEPFDKLRAYLDDVALWSRALDATALQALAAGASP